MNITPVRAHGFTVSMKASKLKRSLGPISNNFSLLLRSVLLLIFLQISIANSMKPSGDGEPTPAESSVVNSTVNIAASQRPPQAASSGVNPLFSYSNSILHFPGKSSRRTNHYTPPYFGWKAPGFGSRLYDPLMSSETLESRLIESRLRPRSYLEYGPGYFYDQIVEESHLYPQMRSSRPAMINSPSGPVANFFNSYPRPAPIQFDTLFGTPSYLEGYPSFLASQPHPLVTRPTPYGQPPTVHDWGILNDVQRRLVPQPPMTSANRAQLASLQMRRPVPETSTSSGEHSDNDVSATPGNGNSYSSGMSALRWKELARFFSPPNSSGVAATISSLYSKQPSPSAPSPTSPSAAPPSRRPHGEFVPFNGSISGGSFKTPRPFYRASIPYFSFQSPIVPLHHSTEQMLHAGSSPLGFARNQKSPAGNEWRFRIPDVGSPLLPAIIPNIPIRSNRVRFPGPQELSFLRAVAAARDQNMRTPYREFDAAESSVSATSSLAGSAAQQLYVCPRECTKSLGAAGEENLFLDLSLNPHLSESEKSIFAKNFGFIPIKSFLEQKLSGEKDTLIHESSAMSVAKDKPSQSDKNFPTNFFSKVGFESTPGQVRSLPLSPSLSPSPSNTVRYGSRRMPEFSGFDDYDSVPYKMHLEDHDNRVRDEREDMFARESSLATDSAASLLTSPLFFAGKLLQNLSRMPRKNGTFQLEEPAVFTRNVSSQIRVQVSHSTPEPIRQQPSFSSFYKMSHLPGREDDKQAKASSVQSSVSGVPAPLTKKYHSLDKMIDSFANQITQPDDFEDESPDSGSLPFSFSASSESAKRKQKNWTAPKQEPEAGANHSNQYFQMSTSGNGKSASGSVHDINANSSLNNNFHLTTSQSMRVTDIKELPTDTDKKAMKRDNPRMKNLLMDWNHHHKADTKDGARTTANKSFKLQNNNWKNLSPGDNSLEKPDNSRWRPKYRPAELDDIAKFVSHHQALRKGTVLEQTETISPTNTKQTAPVSTTARAPLASKPFPAPTPAAPATVAATTATTTTTTRKTNKSTIQHKNPQTISALSKNSNTLADSESALKSMNQETPNNSFETVSSKNILLSTTTGHNRPAHFSRYTEMRPGLNSWSEKTIPKKDSEPTTTPPSSLPTTTKVFDAQIEMAKKFARRFRDNSTPPPSVLIPTTMAPNTAVETQQNRPKNTHRQAGLLADFR